MQLTLLSLKGSFLRDMHADADGFSKTRENVFKTSLLGSRLAKAAALSRSFERCPLWGLKPISPRDGTTGFARTPVLPDAALVGALSAQLRRPRTRSATSASRRFETFNSSRVSELGP